MSLSIDSITSALSDAALVLGAFDAVNSHEAKNPPGTGTTCEIVFSGFELLANRSGLDVVSFKLTYKVRIRTTWAQQPTDGIDPALLKACDALLASYIGGFTLEGNSNAIDLLGMAGGTPISAQSGYIDQGGVMYRIVEITLPLIVDDLWTEAA
ncbi:hypothetical protein ABH931_006155 [Streptacidiphilus sp. MAP12-33]|uniref:hypothetical protein n=1 Tax=Streptacidiphilus sp. MAP12-33 TaxID=3156266 RepID=UPI0035191CFE